ncbi:MAG: GntR family transcriptional regulator [Hydrogenophilus sp.]|nr:GntR family transcriptional regulator [Hydrogenophilus sp.]
MGHTPSFHPLYRQIKELLLTALQRREWQPGEAIPSEQELAQRFGVSQGTVRKAIDELVAENLLVRKQGKGTFVVSHNDPRQFYRFLRLRRDDGEWIQATSVPIDCWRAKAGQEASKVLQIPQGAPVVILRRVLRFSNKPLVLDEIYLPGDVFEDFSLDALREWRGSLYAFFEQRFGVRMVRAEERLKAVAADRIAAEALGVTERTPLLLVERLTYTYHDRPVEWRKGYYATLEYHYFNELT